ncbi:CD48 antigen-like isoform X2 [Pyxicephalus adspersus]|uniref:CD48 antigen-like isoform X2 n=1 Tax=Pyxicephalus adspersus TaxID=30357 RepID=UPI003B5A0D5A
MFVPFIRNVYLCLIVFAGTHVSGGNVDPINVYGIINQSIHLKLSVDLPHPEVYWNFQSHIMASYVNKKFSVIKKEFKERLEMMDNGRVLRIGELRLEDSGKYYVTITSNNTVYEASYNLTVYEPVPTPSIGITKKRDNYWCNATLNCSVPTNKTTLSYTWKYRHRDPNFQLYNNTGNTIHVSLKNDSWDTEFMCIVQNPADRNSSRSYYVYLVLIVIAVIAVIIALAILVHLNTRKKKPTQGGIPPLTENVYREPQYIQVTTFRPNDNREEWNNSIYDSSPRHQHKAVSIYATVEHPSNRNR